MWLDSREALLLIEPFDLVCFCSMSDSMNMSSFNAMSIRQENIRFASMFIHFTLLAFFMTLFLLLLTVDFYQDRSKIFQRDFSPYTILLFISLTLFLIFFLGAIVYIRKSTYPTCFSSNV